jgi:hypothetical protein
MGNLREEPMLTEKSASNNAYSAQSTSRLASSGLAVRLASVGVAAGALALAPSAAEAEERLEHVEVVGDPLYVARYPIEIEAHAAFGAYNVYGNSGVGGGLRLSIPVVAGRLGSGTTDNLAIGFGGDILNYGNCYSQGLCDANYLMFPVAAQWNVFFGPRVSVFGEGGIYLYKGFFDSCNSSPSVCGAPPDFGVLPTFAAGLRLRLAPNVALLARAGYPTSTLGVSWL